MDLDSGEESNGESGQTKDSDDEFKEFIADSFFVFVLQYDPSCYPCEPFAARGIVQHVPYHWVPTSSETAENITPLPRRREARKGALPSRNWWLQT